jgi:hypothetical protein
MKPTNHVARCQIASVNQLILRKLSRGLVLIASFFSYIDHKDSMAVLSDSYFSYFVFL